jgi:uncharacterized protein HemX
MSERIEKAIAANKECPHLDNHEIVLELAELEKQIKDLQRAFSVLLSSEKSGGSDNTSVIDGMSKEINYLKDELNKAWDRIVALEDKSNVAPVEAKDSTEKE